MADPTDHHHHDDHRHGHHHHDHGHDHHGHGGHHHDHHHEHHAGDRETSLSFDQKLVKRLQHWISHNDDHAGTYREWARRTADSGMPSVSNLLEEAAQITMEISRKLDEAIRSVPKG